MIGLEAVIATMRAIGRLRSVTMTSPPCSTALKCSERRSLSSAIFTVVMARSSHDWSGPSIAQRRTETSPFVPPSLDESSGQTPSDPHLTSGWFSQVKCAWVSHLFMVGGRCECHAKPLISSKARTHLLRPFAFDGWLFGLANRIQRRHRHWRQRTRRWHSRKHRWHRSGWWQSSNRWPIEHRRCSYRWWVQRQCDRGQPIHGRQFAKRNRRNLTEHNWRHVAERNRWHLGTHDWRHYSDRRQGFNWRPINNGRCNLGRRVQCRDNWR